MLIRGINSCALFTFVSKNITKGDSMNSYLCANKKPLQISWGWGKGRIQCLMILKLTLSCLV